MHKETDAHIHSIFKFQPQNNNNKQRASCSAYARQHWKCPVSEWRQLHTVFSRRLRCRHRRHRHQHCFRCISLARLCDSHSCRTWVSEQAQERAREQTCLCIVVSFILCFSESVCYYYFVFLMLFRCSMLFNFKHELQTEQRTLNAAHITYHRNG